MTIVNKTYNFFMIITSIIDSITNEIIVSDSQRKTS